VRNVYAEASERGRDTGRDRDDHGVDAEQLGELGSEEPAAPAEGHEREAARIESALHRHEPDGARHVVVGDAKNAERRLFGRATDALAEPPNRGSRGLDVELNAPGKRGAVAEAAEHDVRVGHGRLDAAPSVGGRPRDGAGTLGPDGR
jgi:hypothetical protein